MHQSIAPMAEVLEQPELSVDDRIAEVEAFLAEHDRAGIPPGNGEEEPPTPPTPAPPQDDAITLLKKISENQEIDRRRYERENPIRGDDPIYDWAEVTINPGQLVQFIYKVPEGRVFFLNYINVVHNVDTTYSIWIDGEYQPTLSYALQDFGDHNSIWNPKKKAYSTVEVWCLNNWIAPQTYATFFRGWNRWYRRLNTELTYESLKEDVVEP